MLQTSDLDLNELNKIAAAVDQRRNYLEQSNEQVLNFLLVHLLALGLETLKWLILFKLYSLLYLEFLDKLIESREIASQQIEDELKRLRHDKQRILVTFLCIIKTNLLLILLLGIVILENFYVSVFRHLFP